MFDTDIKDQLVQIGGEGFATDMALHFFGPLPTKPIGKIPSCDGSYYGMVEERPRERNLTHSIKRLVLGWTAESVFDLHDMPVTAAPMGKFVAALDVLLDVIPLDKPVDPRRLARDVLGK